MSLAVKEIRKIVQKLFVSLGYTSIVNNELCEEIYNSIGDNIGGQIEYFLHKFKTQYQSSLVEYFNKEKNENDQFGEKEVTKMVKEFCALIQNNI